MEIKTAKLNKQEIVKEIRGSESNKEKVVHIEFTVPDTVQDDMEGSVRVYYMKETGDNLFELSMDMADKLEELLTPNEVECHIAVMYLDYDTYKGRLTDEKLKQLY